MLAGDTRTGLDVTRRAPIGAYGRTGARLDLGCFVKTKSLSWPFGATLVYEGRLTVPTGRFDINLF